MTDSPALTINIETLKNLLAASPLWKDSATGCALLVVADNRDHFGAALLALRAAARSGARDLSVGATDDLALPAIVQFPEAALVHLGDSSGTHPIGEGTVVVRFHDATAEPGAHAPEHRTVALFPGAPDNAPPATILILVARKAGEKSSPERTAQLRQLAADRGNVVIEIRGDTLVAAPDGRVFTLPAEETNLAKCGGAEVLAGTVASLLAQGAEEVVAAVLGVYLHSQATDAANKDLGARSVLGRDVAERISGALRYVEKICGPHKEESRTGLRRSG